MALVVGTGTSAPIDPGRLYGAPPLSPRGHRSVPAVRSQLVLHEPGSMGQHSRWRVLPLPHSPGQETVPANRAQCPLPPPPIGVRDPPRRSTPLLASSEVIAFQRLGAPLAAVACPIQKPGTGQLTFVVPQVW